MTGVMGRLLDDVQEDPAEVDGVGEPEERVRRSAPALVTEAGNVEARRRADDRLRPPRLLGVRVDDVGPRDLGAERELLAPRRERGPEIAALDPAPLHVREVVDHTDDREEPTVGRPPQLFVGEAVRSGDDLLPLPSRESEQELALVGRGSR